MNLESGNRRWPERYTLLAFCIFATFICYIDRVNISVAAIAMQQEFGWSNTDKGVVFSTIFIGYLISQVVAGYLANRFGGKLILGMAVLCWSIFTMFTPLAGFASLGLLIAARIALGIGETAIFPACYTLIARWIPTHERSRAIAILLCGNPLGTIVALMTTGLIVTQHGCPMLFYVLGVVGFLWVVLWLWRISEYPSTVPRISDAERNFLSPLSHVQGSYQLVPCMQLLIKIPL